MRDRNQVRDVLVLLLQSVASAVWRVEEPAGRRDFTAVLERNFGPHLAGYIPSYSFFVYEGYTNGTCYARMCRT
jgi:hypothetical protein